MDSRFEQRRRRVLTKKNVTRLLEDPYFIELHSEARRNAEDEDDALETALRRYLSYFDRLS